MTAEAHSPAEVDQVLRDIALKNLQLRRITSVLLVDTEFLRLCEKFDEVKLTLEQAYCQQIDRLSIDSETVDIISSLELKVKLLQRLRRGVLDRIDRYNDARKEDPPELQEKRFKERLETALKQLDRTHKHFRQSVLDITWAVGDIHQLEEIESLLKKTDFLHSIVCKNHRNCLHVLPSTNLDHTIELSCVRLQFAANSLLVLVLIDFRELLNTMESEESIHTMHAKLQDEIRRSWNDIQVNEEELVSLRQKLFSSTDSLTAQRAIAIQEREKHGIELQEHLRTIDLLELNRQEIEGRVTRLIEEREVIQQQLDERRRLLQDAMHEIVRLENLIEQIEREVSDRKVRFQEEIQILEQRRLDILNDDTLSPEERLRLLAECDAEMAKQRQLHTSDMDLLEARCDELKRLSKSLAADVDTFRDEVAQKHRAQLAELERQKLLATTPSQIALIEAQMLQLQEEFDENLTMLNRAQVRTEYFHDEHGRYFLNEAGERVYKRDSRASEYRLGADGEWIKIASALSLHTDENGVYFVDKFGQKIYQQQRFTDAHGEYYLDENGTRVYSGTPTKPVLSASSEFPSPFQRTHQPQPSSSSQSSIAGGEFLEESESTQELRARVGTDVAYIEENVGVALRKGLAALTRTKPEDPIGYLADYLALFQKNALETKRRQQLLERLRLNERDWNKESRI
ncbi:centrosomal protein of 164 kDa-like [Anopheles moucheti]|uniref:centrosomal protein of 164 kDa-like n=1 Tax=Anopheles moucheti TaxID=186751 RepID=UPI0022F041C0|nr:centrosomal protein of 164 kDa-like [Anopheles moucheti]